MNLDALKAHNAEKNKKDETLVRIGAFLKEKHNKILNYTPKPSHTPSSFESACFRKIFYNYLKVEKDSKTDAKTARIFETGNYYEAMVMSWLKGIGEHIPYRNKGNGEIPLNRDTGVPDPQFPISVDAWRIRRGYIDNVAYCEGELWLYEIKSCGSFKFPDLVEPMADHKVQTAIYFKAFNEQLEAGDFDHIPELKGADPAVGVKVIYVNKDNSDIKLFASRSQTVERTIALIDRKVAKANEYIDSNQLPPKTPDKCNYCPYVKKCKKDWLPAFD